MVVVGFATGLEMLEGVNPVAGDQAYVFPTTDEEPIVVPEGFKTHVLVKSLPAFGVGGVLSYDTITWSVAVHPVAVFVAVST